MGASIELNRHINLYYIFDILIPESVLVFQKFSPTLFDDFDFIIVFTILVRVAVSLLTFHKSIILAPLWFYKFRTMQIPEPFHFHAMLLNRLAWPKLSSNIENSQQHFRKRLFLSGWLKLNLSLL